LYGDYLSKNLFLKVIRHVSFIYPTINNLMGF
jgi:hypothetical protein